MSLATIQTAVWNILQVGAPSSADEAFLLTALNSARRTAELKHDFVLADGVGYLNVIATTGSLLGSAQVGYSDGSPTGDQVNFKVVKEAYVGTKGTGVGGSMWSRGEWISRELYAGLVNSSQRQGLRFSGGGGYGNDLSEDECWYGNKNYVLYYGPKVWVPSTVDVDVQLFGNVWLPEYADYNAPDDFMVLYGQEYLMWSAVIWLNSKFGVFLPRNEGSLDVSYLYKMQNEAWENLLVWDSFKKQPQNYVLAD